MKKFEIVKDGYSLEEVNEFVRKVTLEYENCLNKLKAKDEEVFVLRDQINYYEKIEQELNRACLTVGDGVGHLRELALKEADAILSDAQEKASKLIDEALLKKQQLEDEYEKLRNEFETYKKNVLQMYEEQIRVINQQK